MAESKYADLHVPAPPLDDVRAKRAGVRAGMMEVEARLSAPLQGRPAQWATDVDGALTRLTWAFAAHIEATEGSDGLLATVRHEAPRLAGPVERLGVEHVTLSRRLSAAAAALRAAGDDVAALGDVREMLTEVLGALTRHRQRGADLLYQAYEVDIGGE